MLTLLIAVALQGQEESVESLIRKLGSEHFQEREKATAALQRRADSAMEALLKLEKQAAEPAEKARIRRALEEILGYQPLTADRVRTTRVPCALGRMHARTAAAELAKLTGLRIDVEGPADSDPVVAELSVKDASLETVLNSLARQSAGAWIVDASRILLFLPGKVGLRIFDVRDLTAGGGDEPRLPQEPDGSDAGAAEAFGQEVCTTAIFSGDDLVGLLRSEVSPKGWEEAEGKSAEFHNGLLILRNGPETLQSIEPWLEKLRRRSLTDVRIELEAIAVKAGRKIDEASLERLREEAGDAKTARRVGAFERSVRDKRQVVLSNLVRSVLVTGYSGEGLPLTTSYSTGSKVTLRASLDAQKAALRVDLEAGWSRLLSLERRKEAAGEVQVPTFANHVLRLSAGVPAGRFVVLGRLGDTKIVDGLSEIVVVGRFTVVERP